MHVFSYAYSHTRLQLIWTCLYREVGRSSKYGKIKFKSMSSWDDSYGQIHFQFKTIWSNWYGHFFRHCEREFTIIICVPGLRSINCCRSVCGCQPNCTIWWLWGLWWLRRPQRRHWQQLCQVWWLRRSRRPRQLWWSWSTWWHWKLLWLIVENCSELDVWMWWITKPQARWTLNNTFLFLIKWFQQILMFCCMNYMCGCQGLWWLLSLFDFWYIEAETKWHLFCSQQFSNTSDSIKIIPFFI